VIVEPQPGFDPTPVATPPYLAALQAPCAQTIIAASRTDVDRMKAAIRQASSRVDFVLLSVHIHWGRHTKHDLPPNLRPFAHEMIDAGVDLFVGHGPHAIRGIEIYRGKPIVHSLGNLVLRQPEDGAVAAPATSPGREGLIVRAIVAKRTVRALEILPIAIDASGDPQFASNGQDARTLGKLNGLSAPFGLEIPVNGWFGDVAVT
jgi:poly-gamma-glutamate capsule biosynthesis protein CapA/YwtB (metallophosphatase superfamily)